MSVFFCLTCDIRALRWAFVNLSGTGRVYQAASARRVLRKIIAWYRRCCRPGRGKEDDRTAVDKSKPLCYDFAMNDRPCTGTLEEPTRTEAVPKIIDLFAGAGGLGLGAARAGFNVVAAVETDPYALETHERNFPRTEHIDTEIGPRLTGGELMRLSGMEEGELTGLIGGPPCQGFSVMGRGKSDDCRNDLFVEFFRLVGETGPLFYLAENVPNILNDRHERLLEKAFGHLSENYVALDPFVVRADDYGAPTIRKRVFFIGYRKDALGTISKQDFAPPADVEKVTVEQALAGLKRKIDPGWQDEESGWQRYYESTKPPLYFSDRLRAHVPEGVGDPDALQRFLSRKEVSGCQGTAHSPEVAKRYSRLAHGQKDSVSKSVRLDPNGYCPTLRAGTGKDKGRYQAVRPVHFAEPRVVTPREAARLQGFPDWFVFHSTKWHSFRQIGNSVSPIVAEQLLTVLRNNLRTYVVSVQNPRAERETAKSLTGRTT